MAVVVTEAFLLVATSVGTRHKPVISVVIVGEAPNVS